MVLYQILPGFVAESSEQNKYQIQEPSNPEEPECKKPDDPSTRFANIEPMNTKFPKEKAQEKCSPFTLVNISEAVDVGICVYHVDDRLLVLGLCGSVFLIGSTLRTKSGSIFNLFTTISAEHTIAHSLLFLDTAHMDGPLFKEYHRIHAV